MDQKLINSVYISMAKIQTVLAEQVFNAAATLEDKGGEDNFEDAQNLKIAGNKLEAQTNKMKANYPHLFKEAIDGK